MISSVFYYLEYDVVLIFFFFVASSLTFMDSCSFELESICGMIQSSNDSADWQRISQVSGDPKSHYSNMEHCKGNRTEGLLHFMLSGSLFYSETLGFYLSFLSELLVIIHLVAIKEWALCIIRTWVISLLLFSENIFLSTNQRWAL